MSKLHTKIPLSELKNTTVPDECAKWIDKGFNVTIAEESKSFIFVWEKPDKNGN